MTDLNKVTKRFGSAYDRNKKAKDWLTKQQKTFFNALTEDLESQTLARQVILLPTGASPVEYVKQHYPGWRITNHAVYDTANNVEYIPTVVIEEDPALLKHEWINHETGYVYGRTFADGSPSLDDERLKSDNPALWAKITEWPEPWYSLIRDIIVESFTLPLSDDSLNNRVDEYLTNHGIQRVLKDFNKASDHDLALIQEYLIPGPRSVRLIPPRKATEEELDNE